MSSAKRRPCCLGVNREMVAILSRPHCAKCWPRKYAEPEFDHACRCFSTQRSYAIHCSGYNVTGTWLFKASSFYCYYVDICLCLIKIICISINAIWRRRSGSTLAQVMAWCPTAPSLYPNCSPKGFCRIHTKTISQEELMNSIQSIFSEITLLKLLSYLSGANGLNTNFNLPCVLWRLWHVY